MTRYDVDLLEKVDNLSYKFILALLLYSHY